MKTSNFGQSYARPVVCLGASWLTFAFIYYMFTWPKPLEGWDGALFVLLYSAHNSIPFAGAITRATPGPTDTAYVSFFEGKLNELYSASADFTWITGLAFAQQIISAILFFLLILGLRNVFRMK